MAPSIGVAIVTDLAIRESSWTAADLACGRGRERKEAFGCQDCPCRRRQSSGGRLELDQRHPGSFLMGQQVNILHHWFAQCDLDAHLSRRPTSFHQIKNHLKSSNYVAGFQ